MDTNRRPGAILQSEVQAPNEFSLPVDFGRQDYFRSRHLHSRRPSASALVNQTLHISSLADLARLIRASPPQFSRADRHFL